jgi:hypothetical protein
MNQPSLLDLVTPETYTERVAAYLTARPNVWVDGLELARVGGAYSWRTRVSECRTLLGLTITNRQRRVGKRTISEYRWEGQAVR